MSADDRSAGGLRDLLGRAPPELRAEVLALHRIHPLHSAWLYLRTWLLIAAAMTTAIALAHPAVTAVAVVVIAGRQHTLYVLNHDASHGRQFKTRAANRWVGFVAAVLPMLHHPEAWSFSQWQRRHRLHHRHLFTPLDPDYEGRRIKGDTARRYTRRSIVLACARTGLTSVYYLFFGRQDGVAPGHGRVVRGEHHHLRTLLLPFRDDPELELERRVKLASYAALAVVLTLAGGWVPFLVLWVLPMHSVYPGFLHFMDLTEHRWREPSHDLDVNTRSTRAHAVLRWVLGTLHRPRHRLHHIFPGVPVTRLPDLDRALGGAGLARPAVAGYASMWPELRGEQALSEAPPRAATADLGSGR